MTADSPRPAQPIADPALQAVSSRRRGRLWIVAAIAVAVILAVVWYEWPKTEQQGPGRGDAASRPLPVVAAAARKGSIDVAISALGTVTPRNMVTVRSRVDGELVRVAFSEGQMVKAGDLLAEIDPRPFEVQLTQAIGQLAKDQALLKNAQVDLERYKTLLAQDSISGQQVDTQESLVRQYEAAIKTDQGTVDNAKLQLTYARITAPIGGRVGLRQVDPGNMIHATDTNGLVVITQLQPITVLYPIPEDNLPRVMKRVQSGETVPVEAYDRAQKDKLGVGKLVTIDNQIDTTTGTVKLRAEFPNTDLALFPNQFVNVRMVVETMPDATLVPSPAIQRGAPGTFVYVVKNDNTVSVVRVKLGPVQGETTAIESGVSPGDNVVVDGADKLREGARVELITPEARAAPTQAAPRGQRGAAGGARGDGEGRSKKGG
ncbi:MAG TPA: MdtA/MuxA family multidrug efflux RND transporter periplasmic adaptor subunit [Casimicrobiaceae bacterium]|nr:MdtA/MuxA family multidrug efflux RND transporter periplasmic adaptor subunit [Casimicrobiaceae bacterium]